MRALTLCVLVVAVIAVSASASGAGAQQFDSPLPTPQESQAAAALAALGAERGVALTAYEPLNEVARAYAWTQAQDSRCTSDHALAQSLLAHYGMSASSLYVRCIPYYVAPAHLAEGLRLSEQYAAWTLSPARPYIGVGYALLGGVWRTVVITEDAAIPTAATGGDGSAGADAQRTLLPVVR